MKIKLSQLDANPFRDFHLYPIDEEQVERLRQSMAQLGSFSAITVREHPTRAGRYQMACGHNRVQAAPGARLTEIEAVVGRYSDAEMVAVLALENLTQRGHNAGSVLDSVAAYSRVVAKAVLLGDEDDEAVSKILDTTTLARTQASVAQEGPGARLLYRAINGFDKSERRAKKDAEQITSTEIETALATLKASGYMARIVREAHREVEAIRSEREERAEAKREEERRAEERRLAAIKDAEKRRQAEAKQAARQREEEQVKAREEERRRKEAAAIAAQNATRAGYDERVSSVFRLSSHEKAFREAVLSEGGKRIIPKDKQLEFAKVVRAAVDRREHQTSKDIGSVGLEGIIQAMMADALGLQRKINAEERADFLQNNAIARINKLWDDVRRGLNMAETALEHLAEEHQKWEFKKALFPFDAEAVRRFDHTVSKLGGLRKKLGGK